ncbi:MAG: hypothetical protein ACJ72N_07070 [Labedaea sp.]
MSTSEAMVVIGGGLVMVAFADLMATGQHLLAACVLLAGIAAAVAWMTWRLRHLAGREPEPEVPVPVGVTDAGFGDVLAGVSVEKAARAFPGLYGQLRAAAMKLPVWPGAEPDSALPIEQAALDAAHEPDDPEIRLEFDQLRARFAGELAIEMAAIDAVMAGPVVRADVDSPAAVAGAVETTSGSGT